MTGRSFPLESPPPMKAPAERRVAPDRKAVVSWLFACALFVLLPAAAKGAPPSGPTSFGVSASHPCRSDVTGLAALSREACVENRVEALRKRLAEAQTAYLQVQRALAHKGPLEPLSPPASIYIESLRQQLGDRVVEMLNHNASGEAVVAILRAEVQAIAENIRAYEESLGTGDGALTTEWNVLSTTQLSTLHEQVRDTLVALEKQAAPLSHTEVPTSLSRRIQEVRFQLSGLRAELGERTGQDRPVLRAIKPGISTAEARR